MSLHTLLLHGDKRNPALPSYGCSLGSCVRTQLSSLRSKQLTWDRPRTGCVKEPLDRTTNARYFMYSSYLNRKREPASELEPLTPLQLPVCCYRFRLVPRHPQNSPYKPLLSTQHGRRVRLVPSGAAPVGISVRGTAPAVMACPRRRSLGCVVFQFGDVALGKLPNRSPSQRELQPLEFALS